MSVELMSQGFRLSFGEEVGNSISHGVMAVLDLIALPFSVLYVYNKHGYLTSIGVGIYMICMFAMFIVSCLYHSMHYGTSQKYVFRKLDHIMILLAIAGSYTPICINLVGGVKGLVIICIEWAVVIFGVLLKSISNKTHKVLSMIMYMTMGWMAIFLIPTLIHYPTFLSLIVAGGVMYTIGAFFYGKPQIPYFHFVWHLCINIAAICHFIAIVFYL